MMQLRSIVLALAAITVCAMAAPIATPEELVGRVCVRSVGIAPIYLRSDLIAPYSADSIEKRQQACCC